MIIFMDPTLEIPLNLIPCSGLIMGSFIACWLPFFFLYSLSPICPICEAQPDR
jgi:hypothetical protein